MVKDLNCWVWLAELKKVGTITAMKFLRSFTTVTELYYATRKELACVPDASEAEIVSMLDKNISRADKIVEQCQKRGIGILTMDNLAYPDLLKHIYEPPLVLYVRGKLPNVDKCPAVGIVGTRRASNYGKRCADGFASALAAAGATIVTGLAEGIDSAAATAAIKAGGKVIGVLGTGVDQAYPAWNTELHRSVAQYGALVSEYPPGERMRRGSFPARNRIISGLSRAVLIAEAPIKSGALITASRALEQGRDVYAIPGRIDDASFEGCNALLKDGAEMAICAEDIIHDLADRFEGITEAKKRGEAASKTTVYAPLTDCSSKKEVDNPKAIEYIDLNGAECSADTKSKTIDATLRDIITEALMDEPLTIDAICSVTRESAQNVMAELSMMELYGTAVRLEGQRFELTRIPARKK